MFVLYELTYKFIKLFKTKLQVCIQNFFSFWKTSAAQFPAPEQWEGSWARQEWQLPAPFLERRNSNTANNF